jgi:error-prone DNA polymerase
MPELPTPKPKPQITLPNHSARSSISYAELQTTTNFSFLKGGSHPEEIVARAAELGCRAIAITDINTLAGIVRGKIVAKETDIQYIVGCHLQVKAATGPLAKGSPAASYLSLLVYPTNRAAYANLCRLLTFGKRRAAKGQCDLTLQDVIDHNQGLLAIVLPPPLITDDFKETLATLRNIFDDDRLSLAAACLYNGTDESRLNELATLANETKIPLVATNDVHYHIPERQPLQDVLTCIRLGCTLDQAGFALFANAERHLKGPEEMARLFRHHPEAIARTMQIADRCKFSLNELKYEYPSEVCPPGKDMMQHLIDRTWEGARKRFKDLDQALRHKGTKALREEESPAPASLSASMPQCLSASLTDPDHPANAHIPQTVKQLLAHEFDIIQKLNYPAYFLTVDSIVAFARSRGILCQGRGAAANSAVCYCLEVTAVNPAEGNLLLERFISVERDEPPDIDIDFEHERREEVIQYIYQTYGRERAALTAEVICYRRRSAVREVGKAMGLSLDCVDRLAKSGDWWEDEIIAKDRLRALGLDWHDPTIQRTINLATELIGFPRHLSQHVGGFVISQKPLCEIVPIENAAMPDRTIIEWDKDDIDEMKILKVDVLGLGMLTAIRKAIDLVNAQSQRETNLNHDDTTTRQEIPLEKNVVPSCRRGSNLPLQFHTIPLEDPAVYDMLCNADSIGVFQVESRAQMTMLPRLKPRRFYDLVIEVAIVRPGPIQGNMVHPYLRRRDNPKDVDYPNDRIKAVLERTLGIPLFQEQAMQLAIVAGGFTPGEADQLRRAMAAWKRKGDLIYRFGKKMVAGMLANGYTQQFANRCFEQIKGFSEYGFPESHAASFALIVYASAWLKCHHPAAFAAALINSQPMGFYQPAQIVRCAQNHGVTVLPVDINHSTWDCTLEANDEIRMTNDESNPNDQNESLPNLAPLLSNAFNHRSKIDPLVTMQTPWGKITMPNSPPEEAPRVPRVCTQTRAYCAPEPHCIQSQRSFGHSSFDHSVIDSSFEFRHSNFPTLRLGMRLIAGLRESEAKKIEAARAIHGPFSSITALWRAANLRVSTLKTLANADAFNSLGLNRQQALWTISKLKDNALPMFDELEESEEPDTDNLPQISPQQIVVHDYASVGLSLKAHPISFVRNQLQKIGATPTAELSSPTLSPQGRKLSVAGLVLVRQRPSTAAGVLFITLEDETGIANLVVRPNIYDKYRAALRNNVCLIVWGKVERQGQVVHVLVERAASLTSATKQSPAIPSQSRDFH